MFSVLWLGENAKGGGTVDLGTLSGTCGHALDIDNRRHIVGTSTIAGRVDSMARLLVDTPVRTMHD